MLSKLQKDVSLLMGSCYKTRDIQIQSEENTVTTLVSTER